MFPGSPVSIISISPFIVPLVYRPHGCLVQFSDDSQHITQVLAQHPSFGLAMTGRIDVLQDDRGLSSCLKLANVQQEWATALTAQHRFTTLDDFIYVVDSKNWEAEVVALCEATASLKGNRIVHARVKSAWEAGHHALKLAQQASPTENLDDALSDATTTVLNRDFYKKYGVTLEAWLEPSDALRARVHREFKKGTMTVLDLRKVKSVLSQATPKQHDTVTIAGNISLEFDKEAEQTIRTTVEYYFKLRTLGYAWAWGGSFLVKDPTSGRDLPMISLEAAMAYADGALHDTMLYGRGSLIWMSRNDQLTRSHMATCVRRGLRAEDALKEALKHTHLEWRAPSIQPVLDDETPAPKRRATGDLGAATPVKADGDKRARNIKADRHHTVSMLKGTVRLCKPWNDGRGCSDPSCSSTHACDVRLSSGRACLSKTHTRMQHDETRRE